MPRIDQLLAESPASVAILRQDLGIVAAEAATAVADGHDAAIIGDPMIYDIETYDFRPCIGSVATGVTLGVPAAVPAYLADYQINAQMNGPAINGITAREDIITAGAFGFYNVAQLVPTFVGPIDPGEEEPEEPGDAGVVATDGVYLFGEPNGTTLEGSAWTDGEFNGSRLYAMTVVDGALQPADGTGTQGITYLVTDAVNAGRGVMVEVAAGITVGELWLVWKANSSSSYRVKLSPEGAWEYRRAGTWMSQGTITGWSTAAPGVLRAHTAVDGTVSLTYNGTTVFSVNDPSPLIGTQIGFSCTSDSVDETTFRLNAVGQYVP